MDTFSVRFGASLNQSNRVFGELSARVDEFGDLVHFVM